MHKTIVILKNKELHSRHLKVVQKNSTAVELHSMWFFTYVTTNFCELAARHRLNATTAFTTSTSNLSK